MDSILTIDIGTSSMRGILYDTEGTSLESWQYNYVPEFPDDVRVEQDSKTWLNCLHSILTNTSRHLNSIDRLLSISMTAQRSSVIPVDHDGKPLTKAIMWQDRRTVPICERLKAHTKKVYEKTGLKISPVFSAVKMLWIKEHQPDIYEKTYKMMGIQDYLLMVMTGNFVTDRSLGSRTNLLNLYTKDWDDELITLFDIDRDKLCDLSTPGDICGHLQPSLAQAVDLPAGVPVISAGGDQQCAALGLGVIEEGSLEVNTGTGGYLIGASDQPVIDPEMGIFCNISAIPGKYITEAGILTSGTIYRWFNETFYTEDSYDSINKDVVATSPGAGGLMLTPHFKGSGAPHWNPAAKGLFYNLSLTTTKGDMARAILEGIVSEVKTNMDRIEALTSKVGQVSVAGGLTSFDEYNHIQADTYDKEVICYASGEATALGAFISAAVTLEIYPDYLTAFSRCCESSVKRYQPNPENTVIYTQHKKEKENLFRQLYL